MLKLRGGEKQMDKQTENLAAIESLAVLSESEVEAFAAGCTIDNDVVASGCSDGCVPSGCSDDRLGFGAESIEIVDSLAAGCSVDDV